MLDRSLSERGLPLPNPTRAAPINPQRESATHRPPENTGVCHLSTQTPTHQHCALQSTCRCTHLQSTHPCSTAPDAANRLVRSTTGSPTRNPPTSKTPATPAYGQTHVWSMPPTCQTVETTRAHRRAQAWVGVVSQLDSKKSLCPADERGGFDRRRFGLEWCSFICLQLKSEATRCKGWCTPQRRPVRRHQCFCKKGHC